MPTEVESPMCATERHEVCGRWPTAVLLASLLPARWPARTAPGRPVAAAAWWLSPGTPGRPVAGCPAGRGPDCAPVLAADTIPASPRPPITSASTTAVTAPGSQPGLRRTAWHHRENRTREDIRPRVPKRITPDTPNNHTRAQSPHPRHTRPRVPPGHLHARRTDKADKAAGRVRVAHAKRICRGRVIWLSRPLGLVLLAGITGRGGRRLVRGPGRCSRGRGR